MSKNIETLLKSLNVQNIDEVKAILLSDDENPDTITDLLKAAQTYSRPFLETELNDRFKAERGQLKGKYMKEALNLANKTFGNVLTNKELEEVLNDPENSGKTIDKALDLLKEKVTEKTGATDAQLQKMLDTANSKISEYEQQIPKIQADAEAKAMDTINKFKLDGIVTKRLVELLDGRTIMPAAKAAELIRGQISNRAALRLKEDNNIALFKLGTDNEHLKKNETSLHTFESLVDEVGTEFDLFKKSNGSERTKDNGGNGGGGNGDEPNPNKRKSVTAGLAAKVGEFNLPS